jgi:hypothetical protein
LAGQPRREPEAVRHLYQLADQVRLVDANTRYLDLWNWSGRQHQVAGMRAGRLRLQDAAHVIKGAVEVAVGPGRIEITSNRRYCRGAISQACNPPRACSPSAPPQGTKPGRRSREYRRAASCKMFGSLCSSRSYSLYEFQRRLIEPIHLPPGKVRQSAINWSRLGAEKLMPGAG